MRTLAGVLPIVHTPFTDDDRIDDDALRREIDWIFSVGADGAGTGMVSELLRLSLDERRGLAERLVEFTAGRGATFMAVTAESTRQAVELARHAVRAGCDAVMAAPPVTAALSEAALVDHFCALAEGIDVPLVVQDASGYIGRPIPLSASVRLLERFGPDKLWFKPEASPLGPNLSALRDATGGRARIFEGSGGIGLVDAFRRGIVGTMPGVDLLDGITALWRALRRGDDAAAYRLSFPIAAVTALQLQAGLDGFLAIEKYILVRRGIFTSARRRAPYGWELDAETAAEVDRLLDQLRRALAT